MSVFGQILGFIFGRNEKRRKERDHETSQRNPSAESDSDDASDRRSSSHCSNDLLFPSEPTKLCYYKRHPDLSISNSTQTDPNAASLQTKHIYNSTRRTSEVSQSLNNFSKSPFSKASRFSSDRSQSSSGLPSTSQKVPPFSKPMLSALPVDSTTDQHTKASYKLIPKATSLIYMIPKDIEDLIKKNVVPNVLKKPLTPSTYKNYFAALLYAEDFYIEKWSKFQLFNVTLKLQEAEIYSKSGKKTNLKESNKKQDKILVAFEIDSIPERRPFLLSRDFVFAGRSGSKAKQFQGLIYRLVKSNIVLAEFEEDFYSQHQSDSKYDISFSFNRVCLKRAHQAIAAASGPSFQNYLFPDCVSRKGMPASPSLLYTNYKLDSDQTSAVRQILSFHGSPPYLVEGPLSVTGEQRPSKTKMPIHLSETGMVVREAIVEIYQRWPKNRILICAPTNSTCDVLMGSLKRDIPESDMFRANAAFREIDGVPMHILPMCFHEGECFSCPSLQKLRQFRVIFSTFVSSFRLHDEGITSGHFSHIFLVDASSAIEPETIIALTCFANQNTSVIVTGAQGNHPSWAVRSDIGRKHGLRISYFERLRGRKTYKSPAPMFITRL